MIINLRRLNRNKNPREVLKISEKHCIKCDTTKGIDEYYKSANKKHGIRDYCKECYKEINRLNYES